jgi:CRP-like cAMP-binding protein
MKTKLRRSRGNNRTEQMVAETAAWVPNALDGDELAPALLGAPLFAGMAAAEVTSALAEFDPVRFPSGRRVVLEGLRGSDFFVIVTGSVSVLIGGWTVAKLGPGDFFGEVAILGDGMRSASVRSDTPLHCLVLPNGRLEDLLLAHPQMGLNLLHTVVGRFQEMTGRRQPPAIEFAAS